jgi:hypothetical protein
LLLLVLLSGFLAVFHLARSGAFASDAANLDSSVPRYLLPVYATAVVVGFAGLGRFLPSVLGRLPRLATLLLLSIGLLVAVVGIREVFVVSPGAARLAGYLEERRAVHFFSAGHPAALFIGDYNAVGVIVTPRVLVPSLMPIERTNELIRSEMAAGRRVFSVDDRLHLEGNRFYSGYLEALVATGLAVCPADFAGVRTSELVDPETALATLIPASAAGGTNLGVLEPGRRYYLVVNGAAEVLVQGEKQASVSIGGAFCSRLEGTGAPVLVRGVGPAPASPGVLRATLLPIP